VSASRRWAIRWMSPAGVLARCCSSRIWHLRLAIVDSTTRRKRARLRSESALSAVPTPQTLVADEQVAAVGEHELTHGLVLLLVGGDECVPAGQPRAIDQQHEPHPQAYWLLAAQ
jgi:hypothetical protein